MNYSAVITTDIVKINGVVVTISDFCRVSFCP